jgi:hypothetical protein
VKFVFREVRSMAATDGEYPLYDGTPPHVDKATSWAAAISMKTVASQLGQVVLDAIEEQPDGATCEEVEDILAMKHQTVSARIRELVLMNKLYDTGATRFNKSGRRAIVYKLVGATTPTASEAGGGDE